MSWMDRTYLDDLRDEARDAAEDERRTYRAHHTDCDCDRCQQDEYEPELPRLGYWERA